MPHYLLRMEAVNFDWSCYDTQDISTIRGGSFLLRDAHELLKTALKEAMNGGEPLIVEASQAVFTFEASDDREAKRIRRNVELALTRHERLRHATFVVDVVGDGQNGDDPGPLHRLRAHNRWRQFQQPTLAVPDAVTAEQIQEAQAKYQGAERKLPRNLPTPGKFCDTDFVRPALHISPTGTDASWCSESVFRRREYGKSKKREFYSKEAGAAANELEFTNDLNQLTSRRVGDHSNNKDPLDHLDNKLALIYLDGNKQSEMAATYGKDRMKCFRERILKWQREFLVSLLGEMTSLGSSAQGPCAAGNDWFWHEDGQERARVEVLLWGGDDIVLAVPAWQGWKTVRLFFEHVTGANGKEPWKFGDEKLTYAAGMVFCHHNAPIQRMRNLSEELLVLCKKEQTPQGLYQNLLAYEVLESFDVSGGDLEQWRSSRLEATPAATRDRLLIHGEKLGQVGRCIMAVRQRVQSPEHELSRRKIERLSRMMCRSEPSDAAFNNELNDLIRLEPSFRELADCLDCRRAALYHLAALWDYVYDDIA
jgi:hypothetical protein